MSKLDAQTLDRINTQMEVATRYQSIEPIEQSLALTAMRLFMFRFGYDQVMANLKQHGAETMAKAAQHELKEMGDIWAYALKVEPPPPDKEANIRNDVATVLSGSRSADINERLHKIMLRLQIREEMIQNRRAAPPRMVQ